MQIEKAIRVLADMLNACTLLQYHDCPDALKLGIQALKAYQQIRPCLNLANQGLLPGETEDKPLYSLGLNTGDDESP